MFFTQLLQPSEFAFRSTDKDYPDGVRIFGFFLDSAKLNSDFELCDAEFEKRFSKVPEICFFPTQVFTLKYLLILLCSCILKL